MLNLRLIIKLLVWNSVTWVSLANGQEIEEVVVSSTRVEQPLKGLSLSLGVVDSETIDIQNADHPSELLTMIPGVNMHRGSGAEHLTAIRSPVLTGGAGAGSFLYLQDGVPIRAAGFGNTNGLLGAPVELADQIEIIRGPSGPIYGANAVHGVINILTPSPDRDNYKRVRLSADSQDRYKANGLLNWHQGDEAGVVGVSIKKESGYRKDAGFDEQKFVYRQVSESSNVKVDTILNLHNLNQDTAGFIFGEDALNDRDLRRENEFPFAYRDARSLHFQSRISKSLNTSTNVHFTPYARWHQMEFLQHFLPSQAIENNGHRSVGLQSDIIRSSEKWSLHAGLDMEFTRGYLEEVQTIPTVFSFTQGVHYDYEVNAKSIAGFIQADYLIADKLTATAGMRVDYTHYDYDNHTDSGIVGRFLRLDDQTDSFTTASPKVSLQYEYSENTVAYMSLARANRPPQTSDLYRLQINQTQDQAEAEQMDAFELGFRFVLTNRISSHIAAYAMEKENFFFRDADGLNVNDGKTSHRGIELDVDIEIMENLRLVSALSFARHRYEFDRDVGRDTEVISKGNDVDTAPNELANTRLLWNVLDSLHTEVQWIRMGDYYTDAANLHSYNGHDVFNLRLNYMLNRAANISLSIRNVTEKLYAERADYAFGRDRYFPAETRTVGISFAMQF